MINLIKACAFVIQFSTDTDIGAERIKGRIEHIDSGRLAYFDSVETLLAVVNRLLQEACADHHTEDAAMPLIEGK